jgi:hypothetical protein
LVRKAYIEDIENIKTDERPAQPPEQKEAETRAERVAVRKPRMEPATGSKATYAGYIEFPDYSTAVEIKDALSYQIAERLMKAIKKKLEDAGIKIENEPST